MKRAITVLACLVFAIPLIAWAGFEIWLRTLPADFRSQIEQFSTIEFLGVLRQMAIPSPVLDRAGFGRRTYPDRGHSPWVLRTSLDGRPRILSAALAPETWLAYSTEYAAIHQLWEGDIEFTGPVYDDRHGFEPISRGRAFLRPAIGDAWSIETETGWQPARVRWLAHGVAPDDGRLYLRYELADEAGRTRTLTEWPEIERDRWRAPEASGGAAGSGDRQGASPDAMPRRSFVLERRFELTTGPRIALTGSTAADETPQSTASALSLGPGLLRERDRVVFARDVRATRLGHAFREAPIELARPPAPEGDADPFAGHDCQTCHNERERVVGPAWGEIALRHAGANESTTVERLARRIREGSVGQWGDVPMPPHPAIEAREAERLARAVLATERQETPVRTVEEKGDAFSWALGDDVEEPPDRLHPSLRSVPISVPGFTPKVGGLAWLPDGRLGVSTWDPDGAVFAIAGVRRPEEGIEVERIAEGLHEPLGLTVLGDAVYVMQKQEITRLVDLDADGWTDEYQTVANDWRATSNFHEFGFGLVAIDGALYGSLGVCVLDGGKSCRVQTPDRGKVFRADPESGRVEFVAKGLRTPNGLAVGPHASLFVTDNQGDWLPASKLIRVRTGADYGWRSPSDGRPDPPPVGSASDTMPAVAPPALWLPQNEIGNSPTQPLFLTEGPYAGSAIWGDIYNGGLKRAWLEEIDGQLQGAAFHFSGGFKAPVHRLLAAPDGGFIVGQVGSHGNWGEWGKDRYGLEIVSMRSEPAFEAARVSATLGGFEIEFTRPIAEDLWLAPSDVTARDWYYVPSEIYGGPKFDPRELAVRRVSLDASRRRASIEVDALEAGRVVYLRLDPRIRSQRGEPLWVNEAWYTLTVLPTSATPPNTKPDPKSVASEPPNRLSEAERAAGWRLLFDGESFAGWKIYGAPDGKIEHWIIEDGAFRFTRDVSFLGLVWNHINPFTIAAADLMTEERFGNFELSIEWRISEGGNSGILYAIPDEQSDLSWELGIEMQVLDDAGHWDGSIERHRAGDLYDLQSLARGAARPVGEWNEARIRVDGDRVTHWLNGVRTADIVRGSREWEEAIAASKFSDVEGFGRARVGHVALQDHGDPVWYRNIKVRRLPSKGSEPVSEPPRFEDP